MSTIQILVAGEAAELAASEIEAILTEGTDLTVERRRVADLPEPERKVIEPVTLSVAALVISVPAALLAVMEISERIAKRRRAAALVERARKLRAEREVEIKIVVRDTRTLADLEADDVLALVAQGSGAEPT